MDIPTPLLIPHTPPSMFGLHYTQFQHLLRLIFIIDLSYPSLPITFLRSSETN